MQTSQNGRISSPASSFGRMLSPAEFAKSFGCTPRTVTRWCHEGIIDFVRYGKTIRIPETALFSMKQEGQV